VSFSTSAGATPRLVGDLREQRPEVSIVVNKTHAANSDERRASSITASVAFVP